MALDLLTSTLLASARFAHGFSTREGGVSLPPYDSLDFALLRDAERLRENQQRLAAAVGFDPARLFQARQVHGRELLVARGDPAEMLARDADAIVAEPASGDAAAVRVADCVPILVADALTGRVAAVHAGWRSVVADVIGAAVRHLLERRPRDRGPGLPDSPSTPDVADAGASGLLAAIGPCIGPCCFEVGADVAETIARATTPEVVARRDDAPGKAFVDLRGAVRAQLRALGLPDEAIEDVPDRTRAGCTRCDARRFYSFRRDGDASGRLIAVITART